jgi:hypothetical protein
MIRSFTKPVYTPAHLAAELCARLDNPPSTEIARREVQAPVELSAFGRSWVVSACDVGVRTLEVYSKSPIDCDTPVSARLADGHSSWSHAIVSRCRQTVGGYKVEMHFPKTEPPQMSDPRRAPFYATFAVSHMSPR